MIDPIDFIVFVEMGKISAYVFYFLLTNVFTHGLFIYDFIFLLLNMLIFALSSNVALFGDSVFVICAHVD